MQTHWVIIRPYQGSLITRLRSSPHLVKSSAQSYAPTLRLSRSPSNILYSHTSFVVLHAGAALRTRGHAPGDYLVRGREYPSLFLTGTNSGDGRATSCFTST